MKRPWQVWTAFGIALMIVLPPMIWLTVKAVEVDRQREIDRNETELARQQAELQERLSSALYRLDLKLLPMVAQEAARPHYLYEPFYQPPLARLNLPASIAPTTKNKPEPQTDPLNGRIPSPLMFEQSEFVRMHFQIDAQGNIDSPQQPTGDERSLAISCCGFQPKETDPPNRLQQAKNTFDFDQVYFACAGVENQPRDATEQMPVPPKINDIDSVFDSPINQRISQNIDLQSYDLTPDQNATVKGNKYEQQMATNSLRVNREFNQRQETTNQFATQQWANNNPQQQLALGNEAFRSFQSSDEDSNVQWGPMRPMWIGKNLILARRVQTASKPKVQVCWLDWALIENALSEEVKDLFPNVAFEAIDADNELNIGTALTTLPVRLVVDNSNAIATLGIDRTKKMPSGFSGLTISLLVSWLGLGIAMLAATLLLHGVLKMSERRAAFVSAVTHELRTPLTTFRMYAEMLAEKMVPEEKTQDYANTLRVQADRLSHLVENVLQFARLERGNQKDATESISIDSLIERFHERLIERVEQENLTLELDIDDTAAETIVETQPSQIEQILFNLIDNASKYAKPCSVPKVVLRIAVSDTNITFRVQDYGPGVEAKYRKRMFQPFCKSDQDAANSAPGVGLGLALCLRMAKSLKGRLYLDEEKRDATTGACFVLELPR